MPTVYVCDECGGSVCFDKYLDTWHCDLCDMWWRGEPSSLEEDQFEGG